MRTDRKRVPAPLQNSLYGAEQAVYFMVYAAVTGFASLYLTHNGFTGSEIGIMVAAANIIATITQPLIADIADRSKKLTVDRLLLILCGVMLSLCAVMAFTSGRNLILIAAYTLLFACTTAALPLINSHCFVLNGGGWKVNFGVARGVGSLGYTVMSVILGELTALCGASVMPAADSVSVIVFAVVIIAVRLVFLSGGIKETGSDEKKDDDGEYEEIGLGEFIRRNKLFILLSVGTMLIFFHNQTLDVFMLQIVSDIGGDSSDMGFLLALTAFLEIPAMFLFDTINNKISTKALIRLGAVGFTLKILGIWLSDSVPLMTAAICFELIGLGFYFTGMVKFIDSVMSKGEAVKGQAVFTMMTTASSALSGVLSGVILDRWGAKTLTFVGFILCLIGAAAVICLIGKIRRKSADREDNKSVVS
ncbi:MAG: MFS transporter [Clostridiales bacterium]|nr:MFS transporter [Clostridiales bacterium]